MSLMRTYNNLPYYDGIDIIFYNDGYNVGEIRISRENRVCKGIGTKFEDVKIKLEEMVEFVSKEQKRMEIRDKWHKMQELQDYFTNLSPEEREMLE